MKVSTFSSGQRHQVSNELFLNLYILEFNLDEDEDATQFSLSCKIISFSVVGVVDDVVLYDCGVLVLKNDLASKLM